MLKKMGELKQSEFLLKNKSEYGNCYLEFESYKDQLNSKRNRETKNEIRFVLRFE